MLVSSLITVASVKRPNRHLQC